MLVERLIAVSLAAMIAAATISLWQKQQEVFFRGSEAAQAQQDARAALELIARDLRQAKTVSTADSGQVSFVSASDADPGPARTFDVATGSGCISRCVRYDRGDGAGPQPIADGIVVGGLQFTYRDAAGTVLAAVPLNATDRLQIHQVDVTVVGQMILADPDPPFTFALSVKLRNR